jgi:hypothetical protein
MTYLRGLRPCRTLEGRFLANSMQLRGEQGVIMLPTTSTKFAASLRVSTWILLNVFSDDVRQTWQQLKSI